MLLNQFLFLAAVLFCIGVYGVLARRNAVLVLASIELIAPDALGHSPFLTWGRLRYDHTQGIMLAWLGNWLNAGSGALLVAMILLFPDGRLASRSWTGVLWSSIRDSGSAWPTARGRGGLFVAERRGTPSISSSA